MELKEMKVGVLLSLFYQLLDDLRGNQNDSYFDGFSENRGGAVFSILDIVVVESWR